ncbi:MAG TPA: hypothetical protein VF395_00750 [Polyangiaceae bacterium]
MRPLARFVAVFAVFGLALSLSGCSTYRDHLNRGQRLYDENEYEHALSLWRSLEPDMDSLSFNDQARYAYLRGMTDFRLGFRPDARHWLAVAKAIEQDHPGGLSAEWKARTEESLNDLNKEVYGGAEALDSDSTAVEHTRAPSDEPGQTGAPPAPSP